MIDALANYNQGNLENEDYSDDTSERDRHREDLRRARDRWWNVTF